MNHAQCRELFVDAVYAELSPDRMKNFRQHLDSCTECSEAFGKLTSVINTMNVRRRDELSPADWVAFWNGLTPELDRRSRPASGWLARVPDLPALWSPRLRVGFVAVGFLLVGVLVGRMFFPAGDMSADAEQPVSAEQAALRQETMNYLDRSKILLLGIVNSDDGFPEPQSLKRQQEFSRILVDEGGALKGRLTAGGEQQLRELIGDLEVILLQIANLEIENDFPGMEIIRGGVDRKGILLKINLEKMKSGEASRRRIDKEESNTSRSMI